MKRKVLYLIGSVFLLVLCYLIYTKPGKYIKENNHRGNTLLHMLISRYSSCGSFPTTEEGLVSLTNKACDGFTPEPRLKIITGDGRPFLYESDGKTFKLRIPDYKYTYWDEKGMH